MDKELARELGLLPDDDKTSGEEKSSESEPSPLPNPPDSPPFLTGEEVAKEERGGAQTIARKANLQLYHYARINRTSSNNYVVTLTDVTGTFSIQLLWSEEFLDAFIMQAAKQRSLGIEQTGAES